MIGDGGNHVGHAVHASGMTIENNALGWQREPTDTEELKIRGSALPSVGSTMTALLRQ